MEREQITKWAFEAGMEWMPADEHCRVPHFDDVTLEELEAFAKLVAAHEREACAKVCDEVGDFFLADDYAAAIRARGNNA